MHERRSFNPMAKLLAERSHPELIYLQTRWAAHVSYERASAFLADVLPVDAAPSSSSIKEHVQKGGTWIDSAAFRNAENFFNSTPFQLPDPPIEPPLHALQLDAGYVRAVSAKCDGRRSFSIIVGRLKTPRGPSASIAYVNEMKKLSTMDRFHHFLEMHDVPINSPVAMMTDDGEDVAWTSYLPWRPVLRILDWFHISMKFEHILKLLRGMRHAQPGDAAAFIKKIESAKWRLWHGRAEGAIQRLREIKSTATDKLQSHIRDLIGYLEWNRDRLIDYGARYRAKLPIATSLAESAVNFVIGDRFKKKGQMRWTPTRANALLHIRVADLNGELEDILKQPLYVLPPAVPVHSMEELQMVV